MHLGWDIVALIRRGASTEAIQTLAAQRHIDLDEAQKIIKAWRFEHMPETVSSERPDYWDGYHQAMLGHSLKPEGGNEYRRGYADGQMAFQRILARHADD